eukprot:4051156-Heterocapsa_arctica.AAC.1
MVVAAGSEEASTMPPRSPFGAEVPRDWSRGALPQAALVPSVVRFTARGEPFECVPGMRRGVPGGQHRGAEVALVRRGARQLMLGSLLAESAPDLRCKLRSSRGRVRGDPGPTTILIMIRLSSETKVWSRGIPR